MYYIIYRTTNLINNKYYIGKHRQLNAPNEFDGYYGSGLKLQRAIKNHGEENFRRETLFIFEDESECFLKEQEILIDHFGTDNCYNLTTGGRGGGTQAKTEEHKQKIAISNTGKVVSEETRAKQSKVHTGVYPTEESIEKNRAANKKVIKTAEWNKKNSDAHVGIPKPVWVRNKISESKKGSIPWNKGKKGSQVAWNKGKKGSQVAWNKDQNLELKYIVASDFSLGASKETLAKKYNKHIGTISNYIRFVNRNILN